MTDATDRRPRDSQVGRVWRAVHECHVPLFPRPLDTNAGRIIAKAMGAAAVRGLLDGMKWRVPVAIGRKSDATADGVVLESGRVTVSWAFALALAAEHLALIRHPTDEPLHGWRYARLLLAMASANSPPLAANLRAAFVRHKVRHRAPRQSRPASPAELERLKGLRTLHALDKLFGEAGRTPL